MLNDIAARESWCIKIYRSISECIFLSKHCNTHYRDGVAADSMAGAECDPLQDGEHSAATQFHVHVLLLCMPAGPEHPLL